MRKQPVIYAVMLALALGTATPAHAQHCDVQRGDSMYKIAKRYHVDFKKLLELNKKFIDQNLIFPFDEVELPNGSEGNTSNNNSTNDGIEDGNNQSPERGESSQANEVLELVNAERSKQGLKALTLSSNLTSIATMKSKDMATQGYFDHNSPTYGTPFQILQAFGVKYKSAGENIAAGQKTPAQVMNSWMNSSGHRANILNKSFTQLGVGYYEGGRYGTYWTQLFIGE